MYYDFSINLFICLYDLLSIYFCLHLCEEFYSFTNQLCDIIIGFISSNSSNMHHIFLWLDVMISSEHLHSMCILR